MTHRPSIKSFMNQEKLFSRASDSHPPLPKPPHSKYQSLRYETSFPVAQDESFINSFVVEEQEYAKEDSEPIKAYLSGDQRPPTPPKNSSQPKSESVSPEGIKGAKQPVRLENIPLLVSSSQAIKSSRSYFDSCRGGALEYLSKLHQILLKDSQLLDSALHESREQVKEQLKVTGDKLKEDLYLIIDEAVESWREEEMNLWKSQEMSYMGEIFELKTQVEGRLWQMSRFRSEIEKDSAWKARASDLLTSNYESDIMELSRLCGKTATYAIRSSNQCFNAKHLEIQNGIYRAQAKIQEKIRQILRRLPQKQSIAKTPVKRIKTQIEDYISPNLARRDSAEHSTTKRQQIFKSPPPLYQQNNRKRIKFDYSQRHDRIESHEQNTKEKLSDLKERLEKAQQRSRRNYHASS